jgi:hypothetical protein
MPSPSMSHQDSLTADAQPPLRGSFKRVFQLLALLLTQQTVYLPLQPDERYSVE